MLWKKYFNITFLFFYIAIPIISISQNPDTWKDHRFEKDYTPLLSSNNIPNEFVVPTIEQCLKDFKNLEDTLIDLSTRQKREFILGNNYFAENLFRSGAVLFGDSISLYINKVAKRILEPYPEYAKKIRFYTYKSSSTNAFTTSNGAIYINIGLISRLQSESELAFILGHEIAHYIRNHVYSSYVDTKGMKNKSGRYNNKKNNQILNLKFMFEKGQEFEADSIGLTLFSKAGYSVESSNKTMDLLYYDYLPFEEFPFRHNYFNSGDFIVPSMYFPDSVKVIPAVEKRIDRYHAHPNIYRRKLRLDSIIDILNLNEGKSFFFSENDFLKIRETCRFESIWLNLLDANYPDAVYDSYVMQQKYPDNNFLKIAIARGLYGISKYKNANELQLVAKRYSSLQGESEALNYMFKHLGKKQMSALTLRYLLDNAPSFKDETNFLALRNDLIKDIVVINELQLDDFQHEARTLPEKLSNVEVTDRSRYEKRFYQYGFPEFTTNEDLINTFESFYPDLQKKKDDFRITYKEKEKRRKAEEKELKVNGYKINAKNIALLDPSCFYVTSGKKINYFKAYSIEKTVSDFSINQGKKNGISVFPTTSIYINDNFDYNTFSLLKFWFSENTIHKKVDITPLYSNTVMEKFKNLEIDYVYQVNIYNFKSNSYYSYFESKLVEIKTGKIVYERNEKTKSGYSTAEIKNYIYNDLINISK